MPGGRSGDEPSEWGTPCYATNLQSSEMVCLVDVS